MCLRGEYQLLFGVGFHASLVHRESSRRKSCPTYWSNTGWPARKILPRSFGRLRYQGGPIASAGPTGTGLGRAVGDGRGNVVADEDLVCFDRFPADGAQPRLGIAA